MSYVLRLRPQLKNLAILVDANNVSAVQTQAIPAKEYLKARGIRVLDVAVKTPSKVKEELAVQVRDAVNTMRKNDVDLANSLFWITGSTLLFGEIGTINQHSFRVPVLSTVTDVVQEGENSAVLSVGISFESNAHQAAIYAADVLEGRRTAGSLPVGVVTPPDVAISFRKARDRHAHPVLLVRKCDDDFRQRGPARPFQRDYTRFEFRGGCWFSDRFSHWDGRGFHIDTGLDRAAGRRRLIPIACRSENPRTGFVLPQTPDMTTYVSPGKDCGT